MAALATGALTLSAIEGWDTEHLESAARAWDATAVHWEDTFAAAHQGSLNPGGTVWEGDGAEAAQQRAFADLVKVRGLTDHLYEAANVARRGADQLVHHKQATMAAVEAARAAGFNVSEDLSLSDRSRVPLGPAFAARQAQAQHHAAEIHLRAAALSAADHEIAAKITAATAPLSGIAFDEEQPGVQLVDYETAPDSDPTITGPAGQPQYEQNTYDLQDQFQDGEGPTFGGDPREGLPRSPASQLAQGTPGTRPLPTGTALGPDGRRYAFFSNPDGSLQPGVNQFATNGSVWDFTDPAQPVNLGELPGIYQASGAYDPRTKQMVIVGNTSNRTGDLTRGMWVSEPVDPANPNGWMSSLQRVGNVSLPGDRESQLVSLKGGGFMLVGASNGEAVQGITAATPRGLMSAQPVPLVPQAALPSVYGPTVTGTTLDSATGLETIQLRVSTWPFNPDAPDFYDPNTWTTTFTVQH